MYINIFDYKDEAFPIQIFIGGRGTGKTYSALSGALDGKCKGKFIYMRRTGEDLELLLDTDKGEGANPFKKINKNTQRNVGLRKISKKLAGIYNREIGDDNKLVHVGEPLGYGLALSTVASIRSIDFSDVTDWFYDEFIKEKHVKKISGECEALFNAYETINRNRELEGDPPVFLWMMANSNDIYNPIFIGLGIVSDIEKMLRKGDKNKYYPDRGLAVHLLEGESEYIEAKKRTALYRLTKGTDYYDMALENKFAYNDFSLITQRRITGYRPVCCIDDFCIWSKKGEVEYYCSYATTKCDSFNSSLPQDVISFRQRYGCRIQPYFSTGKLLFESYEIKQTMVDLLF